jgi:hypothetical protein
MYMLCARSDAPIHRSVRCALYTALLVCAVGALTSCSFNPSFLSRRLAPAGPGGTANIVVSGGLNGPLAIASSAASRQMRCTRDKSDPHAYDVLIQATVGGQLYHLSIEIASPPGHDGPFIADYTGPGTYTEGHFGATFEAWPRTDGSAVWMENTGTVTINSDERSGSLDAHLISLGSTAPSSELRVSGTWSMTAACDVL